jgi:putative NADH-flavin reductase
MKLTIFGATGKTGREIVSQALAAGHEVTAVVRDPKKLGAESKVRIVQGDSTDEKTVEEAITGTDAVLSALGHVRGSPPEILSRSAEMIIATMERQKVQRLVVLNNAAAKDPADRPSLYNRFLLTLLSLFRGSIARDTAMEAKFIEGSQLDWTIVRANLLTSGPKTGHYRVGAFDKNAGTRVSREDVAAFMISCIVENKYVRAMPLISD